LTFGDSESASLQYDLDYRASEVSDKTSGSMSLMDLAYGHDAANDVKTIADNVTAANDQTLGYDVLNRLTTGTGNYTSYVWGYDKVGNLTSLKIGTTTTNYGYASGTNRLSSIGSTSVATNANGNVTSIPPANGTAAATFGYNVANRLNSVTGTALAISNIVYDGFGQRFSKQDPGSNPNLYSYDLSGHLLEENDNGSVTDYIYLNGQPLGIFVPGGTTGTLYYVHNDRLGTPQLVTNSAQASAWSTTYLPYGTTGTIVSGITQNLRFPGQYSDVETGFYYNLYRDYMPNLGRYLESDPVGLEGGVNSYAYVWARPESLADPSGLCPTTCSYGAAYARADNLSVAVFDIRELSNAEEGVNTRFTYIEATVKSVLANGRYLSRIAPLALRTFVVEPLVAEKGGAAIGAGIETLVCPYEDVILDNSFIKNVFSSVFGLSY